MTDKNEVAVVTREVFDIQYHVYIGKLNSVVVYVGTTIQEPQDRFRWHKNNGKDFQFEVVHTYKNEQSMLNKEYELIKKYNPRFNLIKHRKQNLNVKLNQEQLEQRKGNPEWCQICLKRRVNKGYKCCMYCENKGE